MTAGTASIRAQSHSLTPLAQLLSLCQRYRLPLSLLAIQLKDVASLSKQLGGDRLQRLQKQLGQAVQQRTRMEDALIAWQRGYLVLCLPGTRAWKRGLRPLHPLDGWTGGRGGRWEVEGLELEAGPAAPR